MTGQDNSQQQIFDSVFHCLPDSAALLAGDGTIVAVNQAWQDFGAANGANPDVIGPGVNYVETCQAAAAHAPEAGLVAQGILAVARGEAFEHDVDYPCHSPHTSRWFMTRITPVQHPEARVLITHVNITRQKLTEITLQESTTRDAMTQLHNQAFFDRELHVCLTRQTDLKHTNRASADLGVGVLYLDLDGFKQVNDTYGHMIGDQLLMKVAERLRRTTHQTDILARLGGDEFGVLRPKTTLDDLNYLACRLHRAIAQPYHLDCPPVVIGASVGVHVARPGQCLHAVRHAADRHMYEHEQQRRNDREVDLRVGP